jgi:hypothetical protein
MTRELIVAIASTLFTAAVMTFGDYVWASQLLKHQMASGLIHGAGLCLAMGFVLGVPGKRPLAGAAGGLVIGLMAAASFYLLAPFMRYYAMFVSWMLLWILLAAMSEILRKPAKAPTPTVAILVRGFTAAILSGLAFYAISGMWMRWNPATINYVDHYLRWSFAFLPGFLAMHLWRGAAR